MSPTHPHTLITRWNLHIYFSVLVSVIPAGCVFISPRDALLWFHLQLFCSIFRLQIYLSVREYDFFSWWSIFSFSRPVLQIFHTVCQANRDELWPSKQIKADEVGPSKNTENNGPEKNSKIGQSLPGWSLLGPINQHFPSAYSCKAVQE